MTKLAKALCVLLLLVLLALPPAFCVARRTFLADQSMSQAVEAGNVLRTKWLLSHAREPLTADQLGHLLRRAASTGRWRVAEELLAHGADPNARGPASETALYDLASYSFSGPAGVRTAEVLLDAGADPNAKTYRGLTPLHAAAEAGWQGLIRLLVARGASVNARAASGSTPLHEASAHGMPRIVELLVDLGADVHARDSEGKTPLDLALKYGHTETAEVLRLAGAGEREDAGEWQGAE